MRERLFLLATLLLAAYLRLTHLADNPGWFSDEGTHLNIALNLLRGRAQYLALADSTLLVARLPLFDWLLAGLLGVTGAGPSGDMTRGMALLRAFSGALGVLTTLVLYLAARRMGGPRGAWLGALAALAHAVYPQAVVYSRLGFSYNLVAPLLLSALWASWEFLRVAASQSGPTRAGWRTPAARWLALAALAVGLAALTDLWAWVLLAPLVIVAALGARRASWGVLRGLALAALPFGLFAVVMLLRVPGAFLFDLNFTVFRLSALPPLAQLSLLASNLVTLFAQEGWIALGVIGLFVLRPVRLRRLALLYFWLPLVLVGRSAALASLSFYYLIPLLPLAALGLGALALSGVTRLARFTGRGLRPWLRDRAGPVGKGVAVVGVLGVALYHLTFTAALARTGFATAIDPFLLQPDAARQAAAFVNARVAPNEAVIASPGLAWLIAANAADFQMTLAHGGTATPHLPGTLPGDRWAFDPGLDQARFVVVDNLWRNWAVFNIPGLPALLEAVERWPVAFAAGEIVVYERP